MNVLLEFLSIIEDKGYKAYIVGGYVRDYLLKVKSYDIDVTTNATPKQIKEIFVCLSPDIPFIEKYFPEMTGEDMKEILAEYSRRNRRFGK